MQREEVCPLNSIYSFFSLLSPEPVNPLNQPDSEEPPFCSRRSSRAFSRSFLYSSHASWAVIGTPGSSVLPEM